jgi:SAM-dependent methyltransferase
MQRLRPSPEILALVPAWQEAGCRRVLDAGCGVGRHLLPLAEAGFQVWGVDSDARVLDFLKERLSRILKENKSPESTKGKNLYRGLGGECRGTACRARSEGGPGRGNPAPTAPGPPLKFQPILLRADLRRLPLAGSVFDLVLSINVINHGDTQAFQGYCRELDRVLRPGGQLFITVSPREFGERVLLPHTRELEPGTWAGSPPRTATWCTIFPAELQAQFPGYRARRLDTSLRPIPFMGGVELPQLIFWGEKSTK